MRLVLSVIIAVGVVAGPTTAQDPGGTPAGAQAPRLLKPSERGVGRLVADCRFEDVDGQAHTLARLNPDGLLVVALTSTGCPSSRRYTPVLAALERVYQDQGVRFLFLAPIPTDTTEQLIRWRESSGVAGPVVRDGEGTVANAVGATSTTDVIVLDRSRTVVYHGAVDDQYGLGYALDEPRHRYLDSALRRLLEGKRPEVAATDAPGCDLDFGGVATTASTVTYHNRVSRIVQAACLDCHRDGGVGPFSLESYDEVVANQAMIRRVVRQGLMPPWFAAPTEGSEGMRWANEPAFSSEDRADLLAWLEGNRAEGDPGDGVTAPIYPREWSIGEPDIVFELPAPVEVKAEGVLPYRYQTVQTNLDHDVWVDAIEIQPSAPEVTHHVLALLAPQGQKRPRDVEHEGFFAAYVPGRGAVTYPEGYGKRIPAGSSLVFQLHYTPNGTAAVDRTRIGLRLTREKPRHEVHVVGIANPRLRIPPGADNHAESSTIPISTPVKLLAFMPHMHVRGKACRFELMSAEGERKTLLDVPRYDFNWQLDYRLAEPLAIAPGDRIQFTGWFDNSDGNPANPDPNATVRWGDQTFEEMLLGYVEYVSVEPEEATAGVEAAGATGEKPAEATAAPGQNSLTPDRARQLFDRLDQDGNGVLTQEEAPRYFDRLDRDGDGRATLEESLEAVRRYLADRAGSGEASVP